MPSWSASGLEVCPGATRRARHATGPRCRRPVRRRRPNPRGQRPHAREVGAGESGARPVRAGGVHLCRQRAGQLEQRLIRSGQLVASGLDCRLHGGRMELHVSPRTWWFELGERFGRPGRSARAMARIFRHSAYPQPRPSAGTPRAEGKPERGHHRGLRQLMPVPQARRWPAPRSGCLRLPHVHARCRRPARARRQRPRGCAPRGWCRRAVCPWRRVAACRTCGGARAPRAGGGTGCRERMAARPGSAASGRGCSWWQQVPPDTCLIVGVDSGHESDAGRSDDADRPTAAIQRVPAGRLVQVTQQQHATASVLDDRGNTRKHGADVPVPVRVCPAGQVGHQHVDDQEPRPVTANGVRDDLDVGQSHRPLPQVAVVVAEREAGQRMDASRVSTGRVEPGSDGVCQPVLGRHDHHIAERAR